MATTDIMMGLLGGGLLGLAATLLLAGLGRVVGVSSILGDALFRRGTHWDWGFIGGLCVVGGLWSIVRPSYFADKTGTSLGMAILAGLLVGIGVRLGSGCTSGHGICGISRLSKRSIVATCVFMSAAIATVYVLRHILGGPV
jgi:uncharacterized membrane protein YedE/YeeE